MANYLKNLRIKSIGSVDKPCNEQAVVQLIKRRGDLEGGEKVDKDPIAESVLKGLNTFLSSLPQSIAKMFRKEDQPLDLSEILKKLPEEYQNSIPELLEKLAKADKVDDLEKQNQELEKQNQELKKQLDNNNSSGTGDPAAGDSSDDLFKNLDPAVKKRLEDSEKAAADALALVQKMQDEALTKQFEDLAKSFKALPIEVAKIAPVLKKCSASLPAEEFDLLKGVLNAADEALIQAGIFQELGKGGGLDSNNSAEAEANRRAEELRKADPKLTYEQAMAKVWQDNDLMKRYMDELSNR
jgi:hypothetical protein